MSPNQGVDRGLVPDWVTVSCAVTEWNCRRDSDADCKAGVICVV